MGISVYLSVAAMACACGVAMTSTNAVIQKSNGNEHAVRPLFRISVGGAILAVVLIVATIATRTS